MNFYSSLVCIEVVLCLAVFSTALQKLQTCVTKNTKELRKEHVYSLKAVA